MRKLGKKKLLGFLTAAAIVVTTVGSFAVWDTLKATNTGTLTVSAPMTVATVDMGALTETRTDNEAPVYSNDVIFTTSGIPKDAQKQLKLEYDIKNDGQSVKDNFAVVITGTGNDVVENNVDATVGESNTYTITVTPNDNAAAQGLAGKPLTVEVTGTLANKTQQ